MRVFELLKKACLKLGLIADYVVESGEKDVWMYRKWASGIAECWTTERVSRYGTAATVALLGGYYTYATYPLPGGLFSIPPTAMANAVLGTGVSGGTMTTTTAAAVTVYAVGNQNDRYVKFYAYVFGTRKAFNAGGG